MKISVLGCGWLGLPLAKYLIGEGHHLKGSTTQADKLRTLREMGIEPFWLQLTPEPQGIGWDYFLETDCLIVNIPPRLERLGRDFHLAQMQHLLKLVAQSPVQKIIYVSSTSVYPDLNRAMSEEDVQVPAQSAAPTLVQVENKVAALPQATLILRMGGLMGYDRIPAKYVSGKQKLPTAQIPVNYLHRDDAVEVISSFLQQDKGWNSTYNVVAPEHPTRREVYAASQQYGAFTMPTFIDEGVQPFKIISSQKLAKTLDYQFKYPNPLGFGYERNH